MLDGPFKRKTWQDRALSIEGALSILFLVCAAGYLAIVGYEMLAKGEYLKVAVFFGGGVLLSLIAVRSASPLAIALVLLLAFIAGVWK